MTIAEYEKKYKKLYEHATSVIEDEAKDCKRVEEGLREEIRTSVTPCAKWIDFSKLVEAAIRVQINVHERKLESEALKNVRTFNTSSNHQNLSRNGRSGIFVPSVSSRGNFQYSGSFIFKFGSG